MPKKSLIPKTSNLKISKTKINELKEVFDILDRKKTGLISTKDIIKIRKIFCYPISEKSINDIINEIDISGDGKFNFKDFVTLMEKQIEYIEEVDENIIFESCKEEFKKEYLGNKRKREKINKNGNTQYKKNKYSNKNEIENIIEDIIIEEDNDAEDETSLSSNTLLNKNIIEQKLDNINKNNNYIINKTEIYNNNNVKINIEKKEESKYYNIESDSNKMEYENKEINKEKSVKKEKEKEINKSKNDLALINNNIVIYKKNLSKEIINQIEQKYNNNHFVIQINNNNNNNNIINSFSISSDIGSISRKGNCNEFNSGVDFSFSSDVINFDSLNKSLNSPYNLNSRLEMNMLPTNNIQNLNLNCIQKTIDDYLTCMDDKNKKVDAGFLNNLNTKQDMKNKIQEYKIKNHFINSQNSINNSFLFSDLDNNNFINNINISNETGIGQNNNGKNSSGNFVFNENGIEKDKSNKNIENINNLHENNIQILNTFVFDYKRNRRKEKIIKNSNEIPYLIIIDKNSLNMSDITKFNSQNDEKNKTKYEIFSNKKEKENIYQDNQNNNNLSLSENDSQKKEINNKIQRKRNESVKEKKIEKEKKKSKKYKSQDLKINDKKKKINNKKNKNKNNNERRNIDYQKLTYTIEKENKRRKKSYFEDIEEEIVIKIDE